MKCFLLDNAYFYVTLVLSKTLLNTFKILKRENKKYVKGLEGTRNGIQELEGVEMPQVKNRFYK